MDYSQQNSTNKENKRSAQIDNNNSDVLTNAIYTSTFLRQQIGKLVRVEFLIGSNNLVERIGFLEDVGESYILLRSLENSAIIYCDIYSIKFINISPQKYNNYNNYNNYY